MPWTAKHTNLQNNIFSFFIESGEIFVAMSKVAELTARLANQRALAFFIENGEFFVAMSKVAELTARLANQRAHGGFRLISLQMNKQGWQSCCGFTRPMTVCPNNSTRSASQV